MYVILVYLDGSGNGYNSNLLTFHFTVHRAVQSSWRLQWIVAWIFSPQRSRNRAHQTDRIFYKKEDVSKTQNS